MRIFCEQPQRRARESALNKNIVFSVLLMATIASLSCAPSREEGQFGPELFRLSQAIPDPVAIELDGDLGMISIDLTSHPLPTEVASANLSDVLDTGIISLIVTNNESGVNANLVDGIFVQDTPDDAGEFGVALCCSGDVSTEGKEAQLTFFNLFENSTLSPDGSYTARVSVLENDYFTEEVFTRSIRFD